MGTLTRANIPPVTKEFIQALQHAFPNRRPESTASIGEVQRHFGNQEVIDWCSQFMRKYDPTTPFK